MLCYQALIFFISYFTNFFILFGFSSEFIICTFNISVLNNDTEDLSYMHYSDVQTTLMLSTFMYFTLGGVLEYIKRSDVLIICLVALIAVLKIVVRLFHA